MACEWTEKIHAFHDGELAAPVRDERDGRDEIGSHLATCAACSLELDRLRRTARFLKAAKIPAMRPSANLRWRERMASENAARLAGWLTAAAAAVILCCGTAMYSMHSTPARSVQVIKKKSNDDALAVWLDSVVPGNEFASGAESVDPLTLAVSRDATALRDDGRE